jgi:hypothetical protein
MDIGEFICDGLLQDPERDSDSLEVLSTGGDVNVDGSETGVVDDGALNEVGITSKKGTLKL